MKSKGFSLAEVLITIGIIGIVAKLTLPALNTNMLKQQVGSSLMKGMNEIQQATMLMMREQNVRSLNNIGISAGGEIARVDNDHPACTQETFLRCISQQEGTNRTAGLNFVTSKSIPKYKTFNLEDYTGIPANPLAYVGNDGLMYIYLSDDIPDNFPALSEYLIDVNGTKGPNIIGKDALIICVNRRGDVSAFGSRAWQKARSGTNDTPKWMDACPNNKRPLGDDEAKLCSGAIADNNGQVKYLY